MIKIKIRKVICLNKQYKYVLLLGELEIIRLSLNSYFNENNLMEYTIKKIEKSEYDNKLLAKEQECLNVFVLNALFFKNISELKRFELIPDNKYILVVDQMNSEFIKTAQIKGFDVFYIKSSIDTLVYKITNSYIPYRENFKYKNIEQVPLEERGKIITIYSPKGGTGKTTLGINMAMQYVQKGLKTLVVDFSQYSFIASVFDKTSKTAGLSSVLTEIEKEHENGKELNIKALLVEHIKRYEIDKMNLDILSGAQPLKIDKVSADIIRQIIRVLRQLEYDVIIIDTSSELCIRNIIAFELSDSILLISNPDVFSGLALIQVKEILNTLGLVNKCKLIINNYEEALEFSYLDLESELQIPIIAVIPNNNEIQYCSNVGKPIGFNKKNKINTHFRKAAHAFVPIFSENEIKNKPFIFF